MHEVLAMFNIFYDDRGKGAERTVPVHIINFNFNFLKLISSLSLGCLHEGLACHFTTIKGSTDHDSKYKTWSF